MEIDAGNLPLVPFNYLLEFGLFFLAKDPVRIYRRDGRPLVADNWPVSVMVATSFTICTFVRSSVIGCNDLGWRGFLVAQFVLVYGPQISSPAASQQISFPPGNAGARIFLVLGAAGTIYDLTLTRFYPMLADSGIVPPLDWMSPDREFGKRTYADRAAYEWVHSATPETAAIQFNLKVDFKRPPRCSMPTGVRSRPTQPATSILEAIQNCARRW